MAAAGNLVDQIISPVSVRKIRNTCSAAAPMTTNPEPVIKAPPKFGTPQFRFGTTAGAKFLIDPSGCCQSTSPAVKSTATNLPQGGLVQGRPIGESKNRLAM